MDKKTFAAKLAHYASREPKVFVQFDSYYKPEASNIDSDVEGDVMFVKETVELMNGKDVRVLIPYSTDVKVAIRLLKKVVKWLKNKPDFLDSDKSPLVRNNREMDELPF
jgi:hypothetical protein